MRHWFSRIGTYLQTHYALQLEYRLELFFWVLTQIWPLFWMALWAKGGEPRLGFPPEAFLRYYFFAWLATQFNTTWSAYLLATMILRGDLAPLLLRPFPVLLDLFTEHLGTLFAQLPLTLLVAAAVAAAVPEVLSAPLRALPWFLFFAAMAFTFEFFLGVLVGSLSFWLEKSTGLMELWHVLRVFLGGVAVPLLVLPKGVFETLFWTPFPYFGYLPGALFAGMPAPVGKGALLLSLWTLLVMLLALWVFRRGLRRFSAMGA